VDCIPGEYRDGAKGGRYNIGMRWKLERCGPNQCIIGVKVENRTTGGIHRCTTGMRVVSGLPGHVERNTRRNTGFTVGEAKTSFAWKGYRGNWGFDGRCGCFIGEPG